MEWAMIGLALLIGKEGVPSRVKHETVGLPSGCTPDKSPFFRKLQGSIRMN
jgi:hypothetical protein